MSIATRTGDEGTTGLVYGQRVPKDHPRVEAVGRFDEFNAALGWAKCQVGKDAEIVAQLEAMQRDLVNLMGELAADDSDQARYAESKFGKITEAELARIDDAIRKLESTPISYEGWATPGKTPAAAALDLARVAARRAERHLVTILSTGGVVRPLLIRYVNRASDLLWLLARRAES
jgi:cob(I)alamin adenosyltransferase